MRRSMILIQTALSSPHKVTIEQFLPRSGASFLGIALIAVAISALNNFCQSLRVPLAYGDERILHGELATTASYRSAAQRAGNTPRALVSNAGEYGRQLYQRYHDVDRLCRCW